ncbi:non-homologous end joining protein Ku [Rhodococcus sp. UNC363MFTsu5.1]|uniref:non-homologous end joining protein Ku n=1 Tax=Rhodococcus sp. UNC363MFTsu5.1 TaxID=1449069 RepID=UPI00055A36EA|nr:Ku protein [Rhodococcus sp. UNC363MFTsu5.1]
MRSIWKGTVTFGLVAIPVSLYAATGDKDVPLHQVHAADGGRIRYQRVCTLEDVEVPYEEIARGFETDDGVVILTDEDFGALPLSGAKTVEVVEFVPLESIDPIYFDKSYFLEPQQSAVKPYVTLRDALHKSGQVAVSKIAIRQRESLAVLRVYGDVIMVNTMRWPDEVRMPDFAFLEKDAPQVKPKERAMAGSLIEAKVAGDEVTEPPTTATETDEDVSSLIDALTASVDARKSRGTKSASGAKAKTSKRTRAGGGRSRGGSAKAATKGGRQRKTRSTKKAAS